MQTEPGSILVVDDGPLDREVITRHLEGKGHRVTAAESGQQALDLIAEQSFDLVLLDIIMEGMDGIEVLETLRKIYPMAELPVIMVTIKDESATIAEALNLGANDYVSKPDKN